VKLKNKNAVYPIIGLNMETEIAKHISKMTPKEAGEKLKELLVDRGPVFVRRLIKKLQKEDPQWWQQVKSQSGSAITNLTP